MLDAALALFDKTDEDTWEKYVRHFCTYYDCDERQKSQAFGILKDVQKRHQYLTVVLPRCLQAAVVAGLIQEHSEPPKKKQATPTRSNAGSKKKNGAATSVEVEEAQVVPPVQASPEVETPEA